MKRIASFDVDHNKLLPGLYTSRKDESKGVKATTYDLRVTIPNSHPPMELAAIHTIEHLCATYLRNDDEFGSEVIYFGPMGCRTGFYLVLFGEKTPEEIYDKVVELFEFVKNFEGIIPGATAIECGNYLEHNLTWAKYYAEKYLLELKQKRFVYPK